MRPLGASEVDTEVRFTSDSAAQWTGAMRGPAFFAYADNYLIDVKFGIIVDVEASRAIRQTQSQSWPHGWAAARGLGSLVACWNTPHLCLYL